jgi:O-methyltransferase
MSPLEYAQQIAYSTKETLKFSYDMAVKYKDTPGVYVECGVAAGAQIIAMHSGAPNKIIHAFDSFEGIPLPSNMDDQYPGIRIFQEGERQQMPRPGKQALVSSGATVVPEHDFINHMIKAGVDLTKIRMEKGWFENIVPLWSEIFSGTKISILRLDGDLYNSTWVCLNHLFPHVINGGCVIIDDFGLLGCRDALLDYLRKRDIKAEIIPINGKTMDGPVYFIK